MSVQDTDDRNLAEDTVEMAQGLAVRNLEFMLRHNANFVEVSLVSVLMLEFALVQMTHQKPQYLKHRLNRVKEIEAQLRDACSHNISVVTPNDIQEYQEMFRDRIVESREVNAGTRKQ
jgi:hypothetical protein